MSSSTIFLDQRSRFAAALNRFDPFKREPLFRIPDPLVTGRLLRDDEGGIPWLRAGGFYALFVLPQVILSLVSDSILGGRFWAEGGMYNDVGMAIEDTMFALWIVLLLLSRRSLGSLMNDLEGTGAIRHVDLADPRNKNGPFLRMAEWLTRLSPLRSLTWFVGLLLVNCWSYQSLIAQGDPSWIYATATRGTPLYWLHVGGYQPNVAGMFDVVIQNAVFDYLVVLAVRLLVVFACLCELIADDRSLRILPTHPDRTGGLLSVGQIALLLSVFTFAAGLTMTGYTLRFFQTCTMTGQRPWVDHGPVPLFYIDWGLYFLIGPLLFFLPLWPLRRAMARSKRQYLVGAEKALLNVQFAHNRQSDDCQYDGTRLQQESALAAVVESAAQMAVWPFDVKTFLRFGGVLVTPILPVLTTQGSRIVQSVREFFLAG